MEPYVINIGRSLGSGGRCIGHILAKDLGITYYDREILMLAAKESGFRPEIFERHDEKNNFFDTFGSMIPFLGGSQSFYVNELSNENLFRIQSEAIRKAAQKESCIFIGRCADYVLRDYKRCVNVFITADTKDRIKQVCESTQCTEEEAADIINKADKERADYYNFFSNGRWGYARTYDLCINSSILGMEKTAEFIEQFVRTKFNF